jgi:hypothetical protein
VNVTKTFLSFVSYKRLVKVQRSGYVDGYAVDHDMLFFATVDGREGTRIKIERGRLVFFPRLGAFFYQKTIAGNRLRDVTYDGGNRTCRS